MKLKYAGIAVLSIALAALAVQQGEKQMTYKNTSQPRYML